MNQSATPLERVQIENDVFEGENNVYVLGDPASAGVTLVDTGMATPDIQAQLEAGLDELGLGFADVDAVVVTHFHADHAGLAGAIQAASDATVYAHHRDAPLIENDPDAWREFDAERDALLDAWGMPSEKQAALREYLVSFPDQPEPAPTVTTVSGGDTIETPSCDLEVVPLPGHTDGLIGLSIDGVDGRELFTGDALLPYYTPNVGGADVRPANPLASYIESLTRIIDRDPAVAHPGHRSRITDTAGRALEILRHHRDRTARVSQALEERGTATPWEISAALFGHLEEIHILHGPGEVSAHLRHLETHGFVERTDGEWTVTGDPVLEDLFPDVVA